MTRIVRRSPAPVESRYQAYKPYLRQDFAYGCAYCAIHENEFGGAWHFHVEHYRPKSRFPDLLTTYDNLLYACGTCNVYKGDDWPSDDPVADRTGYLDPTAVDFDDHFTMNDDELEPRSGAAAYMIAHLHLNRHQLKRVRANRRNLERRHHLIVSLIDLALRQNDLLLQRAHLTVDERRELQAVRRLLEAERQAELTWMATIWTPLPVDDRS